MPPKKKSAPGWASKAYRKTHAAIAAAVPVVVAALADGHVSAAEVVEILSAVLGVAGVWAASNGPGA